MERITRTLVKWLANKFGYKVAMIKVEDCCITVDGDADFVIHIKDSLMDYADFVGYADEHGTKNSMVPKR